MTTHPAEPRERIDDLSARLAAAAPTDDRFALAMELGLAWLELYDGHNDERALGEAIDCLQGTMAGSFGHPERHRWMLALGLSLAERGQRQRSLLDLHEAIGWLSGLYVAAPAGCPERSRAAARLGELCWARYWLLRYGTGSDTARALSEVDSLLDRVLPLVAAPHDPTDLSDARLVAGLALLERYELTGEPVHLDRGVDLLTAASIWDLPADDPRRCQAGAELVDALRQQAILDGLADTLDLAVAAAVRTLAGASPADGTAWFLLHRYTASAAHHRWRIRRERDDLALAYRCWQPLLAEGLDRFSAREYRTLLADRARHGA